MHAVQGVEKAQQSLNSDEDKKKVLESIWV